MCNITALDRIRNERKRTSLRITDIDEKMRKDRSRQFERVEKRKNDEIDEIRVQESRGKGRPKKK